MDIYEKLQKVYDTHPSTAPASKNFTEILKILFTPEEAALAAEMSFKSKPAKDIAASAGLSAEKAGEMLENMANKAIIYAKKGKDGAVYGLVPTIPGLFEFPFMKGMGNPTLERLAKLWEDYHKEVFGNSFSGNPTPLMRVVPVEKSITAANTVHPYEEVAEFIGRADYIALTNCACRVSVAKCDKPKDVCLIFDSAARFLVDRGYAWEISKEEGMKVLDRSEKAGLVHTSNNSRDRANLICNCCSCCCTVLRGLTDLGNRNAFSPSRFVAEVDAAVCNGCSICADGRCPAGAIEMTEGAAKINGERCIGCGLCVTGCPAEAMSLAEREKAPEIPATVQEMGIKVANEKGRLQDFIKIIQR